jgi:predicted membrane channel-forming protein YqfA (hemolysin III family)
VPVALEAAWRAWQAWRGKRLPSPTTGRLEAMLLIVVGATIAGGLGLLAGGGRPREALHFVYAVLAIATLPVANSIARRFGPLAQAWVALGAALVISVVIARLFGTG